MKICNLNFNSVNFNKLNFAHQNPINFKGNQKEDSLDLSLEARAKALIAKLKQENEQLLAKSDELIRQIEENQKIEDRNNDVCRQYRSLNNELYKTKHKIEANFQAISNLESSPTIIYLFSSLNLLLALTVATGILPYNKVFLNLI